MRARRGPARPDETGFFDYSRTGAGSSYHERMASVRSRRHVIVAVAVVLAIAVAVACALVVASGVGVR